MIQKQITPGKTVFVECLSTLEGLKVVFEDDGKHGFFYAVTEGHQEPSVEDGMLVYTIENPNQVESISISIRWSKDGQKAALFLNDFIHAIFDFKNKKGYGRFSQTPPEHGWVRSVLVGTDNVLAEFRPSRDSQKEKQLIATLNTLGKTDTAQDRLSVYKLLLNSHFFTPVEDTTSEKPNLYMFPLENKPSEFLLYLFPEEKTLQAQFNIPEVASKKITGDELFHALKESPISNILISTSENVHTLIPKEDFPLIEALGKPQHLNFKSLVTQLSRQMIKPQTDAEFAKKLTPLLNDSFNDHSFVEKAYLFEAVTRPNHLFVGLVHNEKDNAKIAALYSDLARQIKDVLDDANRVEITHLNKGTYLLFAVQESVAAIYEKA